MSVPHVRENVLRAQDIWDELSSWPGSVGAVGNFAIQGYWDGIPPLMSSNDSRRTCHAFVAMAGQVLFALSENWCSLVPNDHAQQHAAWH